MKTIFSYSKKYFLFNSVFFINMIIFSVLNYIWGNNFNSLLFGLASLFFILIMYLSYTQKYVEFTDDYIQVKLFNQKKYYFKDLTKIEHKNQSYFFSFMNKTIEVKKQYIKNEEQEVFFQQFSMCKERFTINQFKTDS